MIGDVVATLVALLVTMYVVYQVGRLMVGNALQGPPPGRPDHAYRCDGCHCTYPDAAGLSRHYQAQHTDEHVRALPKQGGPSRERTT